MLDNSLITKSGKVLSMAGVQHDIFCDTQLHTPLDKFLNGGVRIKINGEIMAVEALRPLTEKQTDIVNRLLRQNEIYQLIVSIAGHYEERNEFRRIRGLRI